MEQSPGDMSDTLTVTQNGGGKAGSEWVYSTQSISLIC